MIKEHLVARVRVGALLDYFVADDKVDLELPHLLDGAESATLLINLKVLIIFLVLRDALAEPIPVRRVEEGRRTVLDCSEAA